MIMDKPNSYKLLVENTFINIQNMLLAKNVMAKWFIVCINPKLMGLYGLVITRLVPGSMPEIVIVQEVFEQILVFQVQIEHF